MPDPADKIFEPTPIDANASQSRSGLSPADMIMDDGGKGQSRFRTAIDQSGQFDPDQTARVFEVIKQTGLPSSLVSDNLDELEQRVKSQSFDLETFRQTSPIVAKWIEENPRHAAIAREDLDRLPFYERWVRSIGSGLQKGTRTVEMGRTGFEIAGLRSSGKLTPDLDAKAAELERQISDAPDVSGFGSYLQSASQIASLYVDMGLESVDEALVGTTAGITAAAVAGQVGPQVLAPEEIVTVPAAAATGFGMGLTAGMAKEAYILESGLSYLELDRMRGANGERIPEDVKQGISTTVGVANAALEIVGLKFMAAPVKAAAGRFITRGATEALKRPTYRAAARDAATAYAATVGAEVATEVLQEGNNIIGEEIAKAMSEGEYDPFVWADTVHRLTEIATETFKGMVLIGLPGPGINFSVDASRARRATRNGEFFHALNDETARSKFVERSPEKTREMISRLTENGNVEDLYLPSEQWTTYWQSQGVDPKQAAEEAGALASYEQSLKTGADIRIKTADYASRIAPTDHGAFFADEVRVDPAEMNAREAREFFEEFKQAQRDAVGDGKVNPSQAILDEVAIQLEEAGMTGENAEAQGLLLAQFFASQASRLGVDPIDLFDSVGLEIVSQANQEAPEVRLTKSPSRRFTKAELDERIGAALQELPTAQDAVDVEGVTEEADEVLAIHPDEYRDLSGADKRALQRAGVGVSEDGAEAWVTRIGEHAHRNLINEAMERSGQRQREFVDQILKDPEGHDPQLVLDSFLRQQLEQVEPAFGRQRRRIVAPSQLRAGESFSIFGVPFSVVERDGSLEVVSDGLRLPIGGLEAIPFDQATPTEFFQSATIRSGEETLEKHGLDVNERNTVRRVAQALEDRQREKFGKIDNKDTSEEAAQKIAEWMAEEIEFEMLPQNLESSAIGWYSIKQQQALDTLGEVYPELVDEAAALESNFGSVKSARDFMTLMIAIASDGQKVQQNTEIATQLFEEYRSTGQVAESANVQRASSMTSALSSVAQMLEIMTIAEMTDYLLEERTVSEMNKVARRTGIEFDTKYTAKMRLPMSALVIGPKLGAFYANLMGVHGYLTMDRWWSRTFNRYRGDLVPAATGSSLQRFKKLLGDPDISDDAAIARTVVPAKELARRGFWTELDKKLGLRRGGTKATKEKYDAAEAKFKKKHPATHAELKKTAQIERAANTIDKKAAKELNDAPFRSSDREFMVDAVNRAQSLMSERGAEMTVADIQATLWYYEKRLYGELGAVQSADISYAEAAEKIAEGRRDGQGTGSPGSGPGPIDVQPGQVDLSPPSGPDVGAVPAKGAKQGQVDQGKQFLQDTPDGPRGKIDINANRDFKITLFANRDLSTFLHESGHFFLEVFADIAESDAGTAQQKKDLQAIYDWMGVTGRDKVGTKEHEMWAESFEAYLRTGKAPSAPLRSAFAKFKAWLSSLYRTLKSLPNANLTPEVEAVMGRLLATDEEIELAQQEQGYTAMWKDADAASAVMTAEEFEDYEGKVDEARADAHDELSQKAMRELARAESQFMAQAKEAAEARVREEMMSDRRLVALSILQTGLTPDGKPVEVDGRPGLFKIQKQILVAQFGKEVVDSLPSNPKVYTHLKNQGMSPDETAVLLGYGSGHELIHDLSNSKPFQQEVDAQVADLINEQFGDIMQDGSMAEEAMAALHNDRRGELLEFELKKLASRATRRRRVTPRTLMKQQAEAIIGEMPIIDIRPIVYQRAAARSAKAAEKAMIAGDFDTAYDHKARQQLNEAMFRAARDAREESNKIAKFMRRFDTKKVRQKLGRAGDSYLEQIDALLDQYEFRNVPITTIVQRGKLKAWLDQRVEEGLTHAVPQTVIDQANTINWRRTTPDMMRGIQDTAKSIEHLATLKRDLILKGERIELEIVAEEVADSIEDNGKAGKSRGIINKKGAVAGVKEFGSSALSAMLHPDTILESLDGGAKQGAAYRHIKGIIDDAAVDAFTRREASADAFAKLYGIYTKEELGQFSRPVFLPALGEPITKEQMIAVALNWGNAENRLSLLESSHYNLTEAKVDAILGQLTDKDWDFVESLWVYVDTFWPDVAEAQRQRTGLAPKKVEAESFFTPGGREVRGGYYPLKYDSTRSTKASANNDDFFKDIRRGRHTSAHTKRGHTEERIGSGGQPIRLDLSVVHGHVESVIYDLAMGDAVNYSWRVQQHAAVDAAFNNTDNAEAAKALDIWVKDIAAGEVVHGDALSKMFRWIRTGFTASRLAFNVSTALIQPAGFLQTMVSLGKGYSMKGLSDYIFGKKFGDDSLFAQINEQSAFMRSRSRTFNKDMTDARNAIKGRTIGDFINSWGWLMMEKTQIQVDAITWLGAMRKAKDQNMNQDQAVKFADRTVAQAQASGLFSDRSAIERGTFSDKSRNSELVRLHTTLMSYMIAKANVAYTKTRNTNFRDPVQILNWGVDMVLLFTVEAMVVALLRGQFPGEDDDENLAVFALKETASSVFGSIPIVNGFASEAKGFRGGGAFSAFLQQTGRLSAQVAQGEIDRAAVKAAVNVTGTILKLPSAQSNRFIDGIWREADGEDVAPIEFLIGRTGRK